MGLDLLLSPPLCHQVPKRSHLTRQSPGRADRNEGEEDVHLCCQTPQKTILLVIVLVVLLLFSCCSSV